MKPQQRQKMNQMHQINTPTTQPHISQTNQSSTKTVPKPSKAPPKRKRNEKESNDANDYGIYNMKTMDSIHNNLKETEPEIDPFSLDDQDDKDLLKSMDDILDDSNSKQVVQTDKKPFNPNTNKEAEEKEAEPKSENPIIEPDPMEVPDTEYTRKFVESYKTLDIKEKLNVVNQFISVHESKEKPEDGWIKVVFTARTDKGEKTNTKKFKAKKFDNIYEC